MSKDVRVMDDVIIDIDNFVVNNGVELDIDNLENNGFGFVQEPNLSVWVYKDYPYESSLSLNLVKIDSIYYFRIIARYVGDEQIGLKNVYINSESISKAIILEVRNDNYISDIYIDKYIEEVIFDTKITDKLPINDYLGSNTINIVFMGFKRNVTFTLPNDQFASLKNSYLLIEQSIY